MLNLTCNVNLIAKMCQVFLQWPFLKVYFKKNMAAVGMTVEFRTIHHSIFLEENSEACVFALICTDKKTELNMNTN